MASNKATEKTLHNLRWKIDDSSRLIETGHELIVEIRVLLDSLSEEQVPSANDVQRLHKICSLLPVFLKGKYCASGHFFLFQLSLQDYTNIKEL